MSECELVRINKEHEDIVADLNKKLDSSSETSSLKKKEMKQTIEQLRDERIAVQQECDDLKKLHEDQLQVIEELNKKIKESNGFIEEIKKVKIILILQKCIFANFRTWLKNLNRKLS